ncbi:ATP-binding protein [Vibrio paucivorans]
MTHIKVLFAVVTLIAALLLSSVVILYKEYSRLLDYHSLIQNIGHDVISIRDAVTQHALSPQSDPYYLTSVLVETEKKSQAILSAYDNNNTFNLYRNEIHQQFREFNESLTKVTKALDNVIGILIVKDALLNTVSEHLNISSDRASTARTVLINSLDPLAEEKNMSNEFASTLRTFNEVEAQKQQLFNVLLAPDSIEFVEQSEHQLVDIAAKVKDRVIQLLVALGFLVSSLVLYIYIARVRELNRNNLAYQHAIERTEKANQAKSLFLATMSHELRTPMNGVLGVAQIIQEDAKDPLIQEQAKVIIDSGQHLVTLLNDILDFSKVEQGKMELESKLFSIDELTQPLDQALRPLAKDKNIDLHIDNRVNNSLQYTGDSARLRQVLFNLVGNAIKFTNEGSVGVEIQHVELDTIATNGNSSPRSGLQVQVTDTGIGIAEDKLDGIFVPFEQAELSTTRKFGGTGLGLSIVKNIVELMGGTISVSSQLGAGTQFNLFLPLPSKTVIESQEAQVTTPSSHSHSDTKIKILLVEDNRVNAIVAQRFLNYYGHEIELAADGLEALEYMKNQRFNLVIMDNHMPNLGGTETIQRIRQELKLSTVIFAYTADVFKEAHDDLIQAGANFVLTKPLQRASLEQAMEQFHADIYYDSFDYPLTTQQNNVIPLVRYPVTQLPMTEEELSRSTRLQDPHLCAETRLGLLVALQLDLENSVEQLINAYACSERGVLREALSSAKQLAIHFGMVKMLRLAESSEATLTQSQLPDAETLQKLINRMEVNIHHAHRLIEALTVEQNEGKAGT